MIVIDYPILFQIMGINLPTGIPFYYELDEDLKPIKSMEVTALHL